MDEPIHVTSESDHARHTRAKNEIFARSYGLGVPPSLAPPAEPPLPELPRPLTHVNLFTTRRTADGVTVRPGDTVFNLSWDAKISEDNRPHASFLVGMVVADPFNLGQLLVISRQHTGQIACSEWPNYWYADPRKAVAKALKTVREYMEAIEHALACAVTRVFEQEKERRKDWSVERQDFLVGYSKRLKEQTDPSS